MNSSFDLSIEVSEQYDFSKESLNKIEQNPWVKNQWPLVYFIQNESIKLAYVGESTNASSRIKNHLANPERCKLNKISIIGSDKFNKSATLDIEASLIQYITAEGSYDLQNGNYGLINHNYYQQDLYKNIFKEVWNKLIERKIVTKSLSEIENSELFKYSPYKALNEDQYTSVIQILEGLTTLNSSRIFISGSAGTGKTILATYLMKLLSTNIDNDPKEDFNDDELREIKYIVEFQKKYPKAKIGLVVAMTSLRESLESVFKKIPGLKASMVLNPSDTFKIKEKYDLLIVDEAHRLRQYKNISWRGAFKANNEKLGLDNTGNELDWILANSKNQIFFYDSAQSVKPSDVDSSKFNLLLQDASTLNLELKSQMRVNGGSNYIQFVDELLNIKRVDRRLYESESYELLLFESFKDLFNELSKKEEEHQLCRLVAGYAWEWQSDPKKKNPNLDAIDIEIDGLQFQWNQTDKDWINNPKNINKPLNEIGCIHTVQGYDLNYAGIIFGKEIDYNPSTNNIEINSSKYYDKYGRIGTSQEELKKYIINIYKTIMYRGIKGTFVYAYNDNLREYFKKHIELFKQEIPFRILHADETKPYVNSIPLIDISAAAGTFSDLQNHSEFTWVEPPFNIAAKPGYFICKVLGESMNLKIPTGSYCLFKEDTGGSRNGKIVLVESTEFKDSEYGSRYTVKEYQSTRDSISDERQHVSITLIPQSTNPDFKPLELSGEDLTNYKVVGILEKVII
jgi:DUF2075 family protein